MMIRLMTMLLCLRLAVALDSATTVPQPTLVCTPFGECEPCPEDALHEPFCQPFGNRRLMHCSPNPDVALASPPSVPHQGETPAWQSCGRIPAQEREDFYEFLACNLFFAATALATALVRSRIVEARQTRRLAARIGLVRGSGLDIR